MSKPRDWDAEEHEALDGLERELAEIRERHQDDPSLDMLRAAAADALPPELTARVAQHLAQSAWSRTLLEGLRETGADDHLDAESQQRLFERISRNVVQREAPRRGRWTAAVAIGGLALAATVLIAVIVQRPGRDAVPANSTSAAIGVNPVRINPAPRQTLIAFAKPDVKLSTAALVWRGDAAANPFVRDLAPAFDAYRSGDYPRAVAEFDRLATAYPDSVEVLFYQGVSRMLSGNDAGAIAPLEAAARQDNPTFADDVAWYLAVARQRSGNPGARAQIEEICGGKGTHAPSACAAIKDLDAPPPRP